jgi:large subunit ribosomal protein L22
MKASLTSHNQPPRKVRLVTELVKGKKVQQALNELSFLPKRAALPVYKLIASAAANATSKGAKIEDLRVENITVDSAGMLVKYMPRAMGRAAPVRRRKSQISVFLKDEAEAASK